MSQQPVPTGDLASRAADSIEQLVVTIRDKTTKPAVVVVRAVVYGTLAGIVGIAAIVLLIVGLERLLTILTGEAWIAHLITGALFVILGLVCMIKRKGPAELEAVA